MGKKLTCQLCIDVFEFETTDDDEYFENINRGWQRVPSEIYLELGKLAAFLVRQDLNSRKYETIFIKIQTIIFFMSQKLSYFDTLKN